MTGSRSTPPPPPGWYDDPWGSSSRRWWDGQQWTGHLEGAAPDGPAVPLGRHLESERSAARWARLAMLWGGPAQALATFTSALLLRDFADDFRRALESDGEVRGLADSGGAGLNLLNQLASLAFLAAGVLFLFWFYRSCTLAREAGLPARRSTGLALASWIIPVINWWWPYQSTVDTLPRHHPGQPQVLRWWLLWIGASSASLLVAVAAFFSVGAMWIVAAAGVGLSLAAAFAARDVIALVVSAHGELVHR